MAIVLLIILIVIAIILTIYVIKGILNARYLKKIFEEGNTITFGRKGKGKDILFQKIINIRKKPYKANLNYGGKYEEVKPKDLSVSPNTYQTFIEGEITKIAKCGKDNIDVYFSDGGIIFPSQFDTLLHKRYPSFPIYYALSRQLYLQNIHINSQAIGRIWKALREQADNYIKCVETKPFLHFWLKCEFITYTKYESAVQELEPMGNRLFNKYSKAEQDQFKALHGTIKKGYIFISKRKIKYDTRAYAKILFNNIDEKNQIIEKEEPPRATSA